MGSSPDGRGQSGLCGKRVSGFGRAASRSACRVPPLQPIARRQMYSEWTWRQSSPRRGVRNLLPLHLVFGLNKGVDVALVNQRSARVHVNGDRGSAVSREVDLQRRGLVVMEVI